MRIKVQRIGKTVVVDLYGRLTVAEDMTHLGEFARHVRRLEANHLVLNLENVGQLDCSGVGQLVELHCAAEQSGVSLALANMDPRQKHILEITGLLPILNVCDTLGEALRGRGSSASRVPGIVRQRQGLLGHTALGRRQEDAGAGGPLDEVHVVADPDAVGVGRCQGFAACCPGPTARMASAAVLANRRWITRKRHSRHGGISEIR